MKKQDSYDKESSVLRVRRNRVTRKLDPSFEHPARAELNEANMQIAMTLETVSTLPVRRFRTMRWFASKCQHSYHVMGPPLYVCSGLDSLTLQGAEHSALWLRRLLLVTY